jgi:hypothetical protein
MIISIREIRKICDTEWRRNPRLRAGIWLIVFVLFAYLLMLLSDWKQTLKTEYQNLTGRLGRLEILARQKEWADRVDIAKSLMIQMESRFWKANSRGLAQAQMQMWIDGLLKKNEIANSRTQVEPARDITGYEGLWQVAIRIEGNFAPDRLLDLLRSVESYEQIVTVEQLDVINYGTPRFTMVMKAYFQAGS